MKEFCTDLFGKIKVYFLIFGDNIPRVFIGKNEEEKVFLFYEFFVSQEKYVWLVKEIKKRDILLLNSGDKKIEEVYSHGVLYFARIEKGKNEVFVSKKTTNEDINVKKIVNDVRGFMTEQGYQENAKKIENFEMDKLEVSEKTSKKQGVFDFDDFEEIEINEKRENQKKKENQKVAEALGSYDDFEEEANFSVKNKKKKPESLDEYDEDLENYEDFVKDETQEHVFFNEKGERIDKKTTEHFDDWDYQSPEKVAAENLVIEGKKAKKQAKKELRKQEGEEEVRKFKAFITNPKLWTKILLALLVLAMFMSVFLAVFASRGGFSNDTTPNLQEPEVTETIENNE